MEDAVTMKYAGWSPTNNMGSLTITQIAKLLLSEPGTQILSQAI